MWSPFPIRTEITSKRSKVSNDSRLYATLWEWIYIKLLERYHSNRSGALFLPKQLYTGHYNPLHLQLDSKDRPLQEPYNVVDTIAMRHDICYRDNENGKPEYDRKMLVELNALTPRGRRETVNRQLVRGIIGLKHSLGMGMWSSQLADELHKQVRRRFQKRSVFAKQVDDIWTADLVDISPYSRSNNDYKYILTVIDVFSKYGWIVPLKPKTGKEVAIAFQKLFSSTIAPNSHLWTDKGTEFYIQQEKRVLTANNSTENEEKSSVVERWNRTMKNITWKYFTAINTEIYRRSTVNGREVQ